MPNFRPSTPEYRFKEHTKVSSNWGPIPVFDKTYCFPPTREHRSRPFYEFHCLWEKKIKKEVEKHQKDFPGITVNMDDVEDFFYISIWSTWEANGKWDHIRWKQLPGMEWRHEH